MGSEDWISYQMLHFFALGINRFWLLSLFGMGELESEIVCILLHLG